MVADQADARIGALVQVYRAARGMTVQGLARRLRDTAEWVERLEAGGVRLRPAHLLALAEALDVEVVALLGGESDGAPAASSAPRRPGVH